MGDVMSKMFTYAGMSTALLAVIAIHLFLWWQAIRAIVIRTRRTYEAVVIQRALNEHFARKKRRRIE